MNMKKIASLWCLFPVLLLAAWCPTTVQAASPFNSPGNPNGNNPADFLYSLSLDMSSSSEAEEEEGEEQDGCIVSAQALMCHGGGGALEPLLSERDSTTTTSRSFIVQDASEDQERDNYNEDNDEDEDDDDDDDGHSSMLSNASLRRSRVAAAGGMDRGGGGVGGDNNSMMDSTSTSAAGASSTPSHQAAHSVASSTLVLALRGGGSDATTTTSIMAIVLQSEVLRRLFVVALVTLLFELAIGHVLEFLKIVKQTLVEDKSYLQVIKDITAEKGIFGLWDGFCPWGIVQAVFKGAVFGLAYSLAWNVLKPLADDGIIPLQLAMTLAGGIGGGFQGYVLSPTLLLKTRVMTNPVFREKMSLFRTTWLSLCIGSDIVQTEGLGALMKGSSTFAFKRVADWASRYFFADTFELLFTKMEKGKPLTVTEKSVASLLGGVFSTCVTLPLDVLVAKTQENKKAGIKVSSWTLFRDELREKGVSGLRKAYMQGFEARLLHVCLTTLVIKTGTPIAYNFLFPNQT